MAKARKPKQGAQIAVEKIYKSDEEKILKLKTYVKANTSNWLEEENITSIGIGFKEDNNGNSMDEIVIRFTVNNNYSSETANLSIPAVINDIDGISVETQVIKRTYKTSNKSLDISGRSEIFDVIQPGISVGNPKGSNGTLGCIVYDKYNKSPLILSNWHVLQGNNVKNGDLITQPGGLKQKREITDNKIGVLKSGIINNGLDCAIATIEGREFNEEILDLNIKPNSLWKAELGDKVIKSGSATGITHGIFHAELEGLKMMYSGTSKIIKGFEIKPDPDPQSPSYNKIITDKGDSGAVWLLCKNGKATNKVVGLHVGEGEPKKEEEKKTAIACYSTDVFEALNIELQPSRTTIKIPEPRICGIIYDSEYLKQELESHFKGIKSRKGVIFKLKHPHNLTKLLDLEVITTWFDEDVGTWKGGRKVSFNQDKSKIVDITNKYKRKLLKADIDNCKWEYEDVLINAKFEFSFFHYDALKVILDHNYLGGILVGGTKLEMGQDFPKGRSGLKGHFFTLKLEPSRFPGYGIPNDTEIIGLPMFAVGLSCPINWYKNPRDFFSGCIKELEKQLQEVLKSIEE